MGKRTSQLTQLTAAQVAQGDYLPIVDVSAGQTKYVTVKDLTGAPDFGWQATGETWAYSSYNSTLHTGVVTVPSDATVKYGVGMWVRFTQATGGTKWAKIATVTSTTLTLLMSGSSTLTNETITTPVYSQLGQPTGAPSENSFVYSYTNSGTGGGTFYFHSDGGIKRVWGIMTGVVGSSGGTAHTLNYPTGFFSTLPSVSALLGPNATTNAQIINIGGGGSTTSLVNINVKTDGATTATESMQVQAVSVS